LYAELQYRDSNNHMMLVETLTGK